MAPANQYEYLRLDGNTFEVKERIKFSGVYTKWALDNVVEKDGALYLMGTCGNSDKEYMGFGITPKEKVAYQVAKIKDSKLEYIKAVTEKEAESSLKIATGIKGSTDISFLLSNISTSIVNNKIVCSGQLTKDGKFGALVTMVFGKTGDLEAYLAKPEKEYSRGTTFFSKDGTSMYWLLEDFSEYNRVVFVGNGYVMDPKKAKVAITAASIVKYNMESKTNDALQSLMNEDWAINYATPLLFENDNEIVLNGVKITKKAKESEVVFVTIKK